MLINRIKDSEEAKGIVKSYFDVLMEKFKSKFYEKFELNDIDFEDFIYSNDIEQNRSNIKSNFEENIEEEYENKEQVDEYTNEYRRIDYIKFFRNEGLNKYKFYYK